MMDTNKCYYKFDSPLATLAEVGGKALSLMQATQAGFPVPGGFVLTVAFFEPWLQTIKASDEWNLFVAAPTRPVCDAIKASCRLLTLSPSQNQELNDAWKEAFSSDNEHQDSLLAAVRSSSPEEDLKGTSFAGGYETTLGVTREALLGALVASFASAFDYRVVEYKRKSVMPTDSPKIAVVVQKQIVSDVSGVAFSLNPFNNCYDEVVISANFGLGETVVGGTVTPDTYTVDVVTNEILSRKVAEKEHAIWLEDSGGGTRQENNEDPSAQALTDEQILQVAELVSKVEDYREGMPVDIEWAFQDDALFLLQSRPVTAYIPLFPEMITRRGEEKNLYLDLIVMTQGFSEPMSVLGLEIWSKMLEKAKPNLCFIKGKSGVVWDINGREYMHISNMLKCPGGRAMVEKAFPLSDKAVWRAIDSVDLDDYTPLRAPPGSWNFLWLSLGQVFQLLPNMLYGLFSGEKALLSYQQYSQDLIDDCQDDEYLKDSSFGETVQEAMIRFEGLLPRLGALVTPYIARWRVHKMFEGCDDAEHLLISLCMDLGGNPTSEMGHLMVRLASCPEIQGTSTGDEFLKNLNENKYSPDFLTAYAEYIKKFGCRCMKEIDAATPRTYERQEDLFDQLKQIDIEQNAIKTVIERRQEAYQKLLEIANGMGKGDKFKHHANVIQRIGGYREHPKYVYVLISDLLRRRALKLGERFVKEGRLERADQIFDLSIDQVTAAEEDSSMELMSIIRKNMEQYKKVENVKDWPVLIDSRGKIIRDVRKQEGEEGCLVGDAISPGVVSGPAKVLSEPYEKPLEGGEILVARFTEPSWTPIFINCSAVVMEVGGVMQHGAIIAREYGIPCVSSIDNATKNIQDGDLLEVNGSEGTVKLLDEYKKLQGEVQKE